MQLVCHALVVATRDWFHLVYQILEHFNDNVMLQIGGETCIIV